MTTLLFLLLFLGVGVGGCGSLDGATTEAPSTEAPQQLWTCSMDPQVLQDQPGSCPICGMGLERVRMPGTTDAEGSPPAEREVAYWRAPMDPNYVRDQPGESPMGMDLVPVYRDELLAGEGIVEISPGIIQQVGVETAPVVRTTVFRHLRTIGEVEVGEDELSVVNLRYSGWIERLHVDKTGDAVTRGQVLFDIYSPELVAAQEEYLLARRTQGVEAPLTRSVRRKLELWDIAERDLAALESRGEVLRALPVRAPASGFVLHKDVVEGARVRAGQDLYRIGNLQKIWVRAEVYEHDAPWVEEGQLAQLELTYQQGEVLEGKVAYIYPTLNVGSRTLTVRLEFENPGVRLKPGMFATVSIQFRRKDGVIAVPTEAILHSGRRQIVFVALGRGRFQPREVQTGLVGDHHLTEVVEGLVEGDQVVTSGQFLIDSESQLQEALQKILAGAPEPDEATAPTTLWSCPMHPGEVATEPGTCGTCGMFLKERAGTEEELHQLHRHGAAKPGQYTCPMHPKIVSGDPGRCSVCGMFLEKVPDAEEGTDAEPAP